MNLPIFAASLFSASPIKPSILLAAMFAALAVTGCESNRQQNFSEIENTINAAAAPDFGTCIEYLDASAGELALAREILERGKRSGTLSRDRYQEALFAAQNALAHRQRAEQACNARLAALEGQVATLGSQLAALQQRLQRTKEVLRGVTFATGSAQISRKGQETLRLVANRLLRQPTRVEIQGHTSSTGGLEFNMRLSQARAESVRNFLVSQGVPADSITARGFGPNQPVASNETEAGRRANQRIEIVYEQEIQ